MTKPREQESLEAGSRNLFARINWVQQQVDYIQKEKKQGMRYSIVSHDAVTAKVRPFFVEAGVLYYPVNLSINQVGNRTEIIGAVRFVNIANPEEYIEVESAGYGIDDQDKGPGKALSYLVKYALLKCLGLETGDDPDEDQNAVFHDPGAAQVDAFISAIQVTTSPEELATLLDAFKPDLDAAGKAHAGKVAQARSVYARKLHELKAK